MYQNFGRALGFIAGKCLKSDNDLQNPRKYAKAHKKGAVIVISCSLV
jgi:hypothetical protein